MVFQLHQYSTTSVPSEIIKDIRDENDLQKLIETDLTHIKTMTQEMIVIVIMTKLLKLVMISKRQVEQLLRTFRNTLKK